MKQPPSRAGERKSGTVKPVGGRMLKQAERRAVKSAGDKELKSKLLTSDAPRTRKLRKNVIENDFGNATISS